MLNHIPKPSTFFSSDEAHFLSGAVNKQNCRYWAENNPRELHQRPLHSPKVTVWYAVSKFGVIGPYFFEEDGRPKTLENVALVKAAVEQSPRRSTQKHSLALAMSNQSLRRILRYDLSFHPYKIMIVQELKPTDFENRRNCCQEMLNHIPEPLTFFSSDGAHFHLSGAVN